MHKRARKQAMVFLQERALRNGWVIVFGGGEVAWGSAQQ